MTEDNGIFYTPENWQKNKIIRYVDFEPEMYTTQRVGGKP